MSTEGGEALYFYFGTRAMRPVWLANALGIKLNLKWLELPLGEHKKPDYLAVNPIGTVPYLVDGSITMVESCAILQYLAEKYQSKKDLLLAKDASLQAKASYYQALHIATSLDELIIVALFNTSIYPPEKRNSAVVEDHKKKWDGGLSQVVAKVIGDNKFVTGDKFTIADIAVGYVLNIAGGLGWLSDPKLKAYLDRVQATESYKETYNRSSPIYPAKK